MGGKGGVLLLQVLLTAGRALHSVGGTPGCSAPYELLEFASAVFTQIFKDRHSRLNPDSIDKGHCYFINPSPDLGLGRGKVVHQD